MCSAFAISFTSCSEARASLISALICIAHRGEAPTGDESVLYLPELLPVCEGKGKIYVTRRAPSVEAEHMPKEHVTSHGANQEIGEVHLPGHGVDLAHDGHGDRIDRAIKFDAKHA